MSWLLPLSSASECSANVSVYFTHRDFGEIPFPFLSVPSLLPSTPVPLRSNKGSPYSITERGVPELIPVLDSQLAGDVSHKPGGRLPLLSAGPLQLPPQPLRGLLPILLLGEQRHDGCKQFA